MGIIMTYGLYKVGQSNREQVYGCLKPPGPFPFGLNGSLLGKLAGV